MKKLLNIAVLLLLLTPAGFAQAEYQKFTPEERNWSEYNLTGWRFGINMGMYLANKNTAAFYSGVPGNENNIDWVLSNEYWYEEIRQQLNSREIIRKPSEVPADWTSAYETWRIENDVAPGDTSQWWIYYPEDLRYDAAISPGFYAKYNFNNTTGIFIQSNYVKLKTSGVFQMVIDSITYTTDPALRTGYIRGIEERVNIDIGFSKFYRTGKYTSIFVETGFHLNSTQVLEHRIMIGNRQYTLINTYLNQPYVPNTNLTEYTIYQGGLGIGIFLNGGVKFILTEDVSIDPGFQLYWKRINLEGYKDFAADYYFYIRLIFNLF
ncbi:MAG: hypothetical protein ACLFPE_13245 [Bacteroidales bacterium]